MTDTTFADTRWVRSSWSLSNGNCVEVRSWRKPSRSAYNGNCAEVASCSHGIAVRDSKDPDGPVLVIGSEGWDDFLYGIRQGAYLVPDPATCGATGRC